MTLFLTYDDVIEIHANQILLYGGTHGIRDDGLLRSAIAQPEATYHGKLLHQSIEDQASAYLFHLIKNHPFIDGNKRVGAACCLVFLDFNGYKLDSNLDEMNEAIAQTHLEKIVLDVATAKINKDQLIIFLRKHIRPID